MTGMGINPLRQVWFMPPAKAAEPDPRAQAHGTLIKERRLDLGLNRPAFVAQMQKHGQEITPDYLNKLERGTAPLSRASLEVREALRAVLGYNPERWQELTGLYSPSAMPVVSHDQTEQGLQTAPGAPPIAPVVAFRDTPVIIPKELQQVIDEHSDRYPELRDPTIQKIIAAPRNFGGPDNGPQTVEDWYEYFLLTRRYLR